MWSDDHAWRHWLATAQASDESLPFTLKSPTTLHEAITLLANTPGAVVIGGGIEVVLALKRLLATPPIVISLRRIEELRSLRWSEGDFLIGATAKLSDVAYHADISRSYPLLSEAIAAVGVPQIRNQATIAGSLLQGPRCIYFTSGFPCYRSGGASCPVHTGLNLDGAIVNLSSTCNAVHASDIAAGLIALSARVKIAGPNGVREISVEDLYAPPEERLDCMHRLEHDEIITYIVLPPPDQHWSTYQKAQVPNSGGLGSMGAAIRLDLSESIIRSATVVMSGVSPTPWHAVELEQCLAGKTPHEGAELSRRRLRELAKGCDMDHKVAIACELLAKAIEAAV